MRISTKQALISCLIPLAVISVVMFCLISLLTGWIFSTNREMMIQRGPDDPPIGIVRPTRLQYVEPTPTLASLQNAPITQTLPEPSSTPEPTPTATLVIIQEATPTATLVPTPTQIPTATSPPAATPIPTPTPVKIEHVVIISVDGLRPDALDNTDTPTLDALRAQGVYSAHAQTVIPTATLIGHASMLGGMTPEKHGIYWNLYTPELGKINGPTLFSVAHDAGLRTAMVVGKIKLEQLYLPHPAGLFDANSTTDSQITNRAVEIIRDPAGLAAILFVHLPDVDTSGHDAGWMSPNQLAVVREADARIGEIRAALEGGGYWPNTLLIVSSDHGGHEDTHLVLPPWPEDQTVPWLAVGPGVSAGMTLTSDINIYDTAATALSALGLPMPEAWDGKSIVEIFYRF